jgi:hypothetical protein
MASEALHHSPAHAHPKGFEIQWGRYESKYLIPPSLVEPIREYVLHFCGPDAYGSGPLPTYTVTTLQLDNEFYDLHYAKEREALDRFKLRIRTYGEIGSCPVFLEIKRKSRQSIMKSRVILPFDEWSEWSEHLLRFPWIDIVFSSAMEEETFLEFVRLTREMDARPKVLVRYERESYVDATDDHIRVTFDRKLEYQPTTSWTGWGQGGRWFSMDTGRAQGKGYSHSAVILELKCLREIPLWMLALVRAFNLKQTGNCKYSTAVWQEAAFAGEPHDPNRFDAMDPR